MENSSTDTRKRKYAGNPWTSFNSFLFYFTIAVALFATVVLSLPGVLFMIPVFYIFFGSQMYYFILADERMIVKNHYWIWYKNIYDLDELKSLTYNPLGKLSNSLLVELNYPVTDRFWAGSLRKKDWKRLMSDMQSMQVDFKNGQLLK